MKLFPRALIAIGLVSSLVAETKKSRDEMVHDDRAALQENEVWIYNDLDKAFAEAARAKKPLLVVHRCVP